MDCLSSHFVRVVRIGANALSVSLDNDDVKLLYNNYTTTTHSLCTTKECTSGTRLRYLYSIKQTNHAASSVSKQAQASK
jgi:hypothetical protein